jgi:hypothetical protein
LLIVEKDEKTTIVVTNMAAENMIAVIIVALSSILE